MKTIAIIMCVVACSCTVHNIEQCGVLSGVEKAVCLQEVHHNASRIPNRHAIKQVDCPGNGPVFVASDPRMCLSIATPAVSIATIDLSERRKMMKTILFESSQGHVKRFAHVMLPLIDSLSEAQSNMMFLNYSYCQALAMMPCSNDLAQAYVSFLVSAPAHLHQMIAQANEVWVKSKDKNAPLTQQVRALVTLFKESRKYQQVMDGSIALLSKTLGTPTQSVMQSRGLDGIDVDITKALLDTVRSSISVELPPQNAGADEALIILLKYQIEKALANTSIEVHSEKLLSDGIIDVKVNTALLKQKYESESVGEKGGGYPPNGIDKDMAYPEQHQLMTAVHNTYARVILPFLAQINTIKGVDLHHEVRITGTSCMTEFKLGSLSRQGVSPSNILHSRLGQDRAEAFAGPFETAARTGGYTKNIKVVGEQDTRGFGSAFRHVYVRFVFKSLHFPKQSTQAPLTVTWEKEKK